MILEDSINNSGCPVAITVFHYLTQVEILDREMVASIAKGALTEGKSAFFIAARIPSISSRFPYRLDGTFDQENRVIGLSSIK